MDASRPSPPLAPPDPGPIPGDASAPPLSDLGASGRTRPRFEEHAPGPPSWPAWLAIPLGFAAAVVGDAVAAYLLVQGAPADSPMVGVWVGLAGGAVFLGGLAWLAISSIIRRRGLGADRYRGPSVLVLFAMIVLGVPLLVVPIVLAVTRGELSGLTSPAGLTAQLLLTPISFFVVLALFVGLPNALPGIRVWHGAASLRQLAVGLVSGLLVWTVAQVLAALVTAILHVVGINVEGQQEVTTLAHQLPIAIAFFTIAALAPVAEELFFRGFVFNAWEREYGTRRALIGSSILFGVAHIPGGTVLAVALVFLLGLLLAAVYARTRSLAITIGIHAAFNFASVLALFLLSGGG